MDIGIDSTSEPCNKIPQRKEITTETRTKYKSLFFCIKIENKLKVNNKVIIKLMIKLKKDKFL